MEFKDERYLQKFYVSSEEEAQKIRTMIKPNTWAQFFSVNDIKSGPLFIWELPINICHVYLATVLAIKSSNDKEPSSENSQLMIRLNSNEFVQSAIQDKTVFRGVHKVLNEKGQQKMKRLLTGKRLHEMEDFDSDFSYSRNDEGEDFNDFNFFQ